MQTFPPTPPNHTTATHLSGIRISSNSISEKDRLHLLKSNLDQSRMWQKMLHFHADIKPDKAINNTPKPEQNLPTSDLQGIIYFLAKKYPITHAICFAKRQTSLLEDDSLDIANTYNGTSKDRPLLAISAVEEQAHSSEIKSENDEEIDFSAFAHFPDQKGIPHYFLLLITSDNQRIQDELQKKVNQQAIGFTTTVLAHSAEAIAEATAQDNRFFITAMLGGRELYHDGHTILTLTLPEIDNRKHAEKLQQFADRHLHLAKGFLQSAGDFIADEAHLANTAFYLHQVVEQTCIALIKVHMDYRTNLHDLARLLPLCRCFSEKPARLYLSSDHESQRLFKILQNSYSKTRYSDHFEISLEDAATLYHQAYEFVEMAEECCATMLPPRQTSSDKRE